MNDVRNTIGWADYTWNVTPGCLTSCSYCWARAACKRQKGKCERCYQFIPHFHPERLDEPRKKKKPARIAVSLTGDLFGPGTRQHWRDDIFEVVRDCPRHTFLFLTHFPARLPRRGWPDNAWAGATAITHLWAEAAVSSLQSVRAPVRFLSCEPMLKEIRLMPAWEGALEWLIIGAQTGPTKFQPPRPWVEQLIRDARELRLAVYAKKNLGFEGPREWPNG